MLNSIFNSTITSTISVQSLIISSVTSIILGFLIAITYRYTSKYNKNFLITTTLLPILVQSVMIMVNGNLGTSIAIMGAFGLVRFRSIPGTSKEILIVFFAMAVGLATGMGQIVFAIALTIIGCIAITILSKIKLFDRDENEKELKIVIPENLDYTNIFDDIFKKYTKTANLEKTKTTNMGSLFELTYNIILKNNINEKNFIDEIRTKNSNLKVSIGRESIGIDL